MTTNLSEPGVSPGEAMARVRRFGRVPRWAHWATALAMGVCLASAAVLYIGSLSVLVGRRQLVEAVHLWSGFALPVPTLAGWLSGAFRADVRVLNRFAPGDWAWLRAHARPPVVAVRASADASARAAKLAAAKSATASTVGKFNAGQKLFAAFVAGSVVVMLGTGLLMEYGPRFDLRLAWRTGATFVHDWLAFAIAVTVAGHLWMAWRDPVARLGIRTGTVPLWWARRHHPAWADATPEPPDHSPSDT